MADLLASEQLMRFSEIIDSALTQQRELLHSPDKRKSDKPLRSFSVREVSHALRVKYNSLRQYLNTLEGMPAGTLEAGNRKYFTADEVNQILEVLMAEGKIGPERFPRRQPGDDQARLVVYNLKGGVSKTSLSANLAQFLALRGYRILAIDLDPQASFSDMFDIQADVDELPSIYDVLRYEDPHTGAAPLPITEAIQATYVPNIDIVPGSMSMTEFEFETSASFRAGDGGTPFHRRIADALELVDDYYDLVLFDTPPHMSFAVIAAVYAARGMLIPLSAGMLDVVSLAKFLELAAGTMEVVEQHQDKRYDFIRFVLTRYSASDPAQLQLSSFLRTHLRDAMLKHDFVSSTAIADAGNTMNPLLEIDPSGFNRKTYDRIFESLSGIADEVDAEIMRSWGRIPFEREDD
ncbi:AAA family ATPase [Pseudooceanicola sp. CBS1P-1]|uniref:AAA family ATPase n=1 Tax=Pseudooceanicola albus TaxID=2692189 RepID=A0A6L7G413_9RHOB|nr:MULTISPECIES: AAA family ATPase [Pseudooceanicola]MBT9385099.1 AAA family ATPase [Pseudooceanicola endophyticus]MXN18609.1 AAA family ATPase [Pseudooceanicola albus]